MEKLTLLRTDNDGFGTFKHRVLYWYPLVPAILDAGGAKVKPRKSSELPPEAVPYVNVPDLALIDAGDADFEVLFREQTRGETLAALSARLLAEHNARSADWIAMRRRQYQDAGRGTSA
jgi:hypothetical protein